MAGQVLPMLVALASIPWLIRLVGLERFGFIALSWVLIGYASLFDLGIGRAVIRTMSSKLVSGDAQGAIDSGRTGLSFLLLFGLVLGAMTALFAPLLIARVLVVPAALHDEALLALHLLAVSLPFVMLTSGYIGVLTAHEAFKQLNLIRALFSVLSYLLPLGIALGGMVALPAVVGTILALRVVGTVAFAWACRARCGFRWSPKWPDRALAVELLSLGGWMSVSNVVGPILTYLDRLLIGALIPLREVGIYSAPYDLVNRMLVIPYSVVSAYFPMATALRPGSPEASRALSDIVRYLFLIMFPIMFVTMAVAYPVMTLWLGSEVGLPAAAVLQILVAGVFLNALTQGPATLIQAAGQPRDMALLHIVELPFFLTVLWALTSRWGIVGTAAAATLRFALDGAVVYVLARRTLVSDAWAWRGAVIPACLTLALFAAAQVCRTWPAALLTASIGLTCFAGYGWRALLWPAERARIHSLRRPRLHT
jgi:O-antigen/teichoic acid export membrane protein